MNLSPFRPPPHLGRVASRRNETLFTCCAFTHVASVAEIPTKLATFEHAPTTEYSGNHTSASTKPCLFARCGAGWKFRLCLPPFHRSSIRTFIVRSSKSTFPLFGTINGCPRTVFAYHSVNTSRCYVIIISRLAEERRNDNFKICVFFGFILMMEGLDVIKRNRRPIPLRVVKEKRSEATMKAIIIQVLCVELIYIYIYRKVSGHET